MAQLLNRLSRVVSLRKGSGHDLRQATHIDRSSRFGNPFVITPDQDRETVINKYREWIWLPEQQELRDDMNNSLRGYDLACWCNPLPCHGDVILEVLESYNDSKQ